METNTENEKGEGSSKTLTNMVVTRTDANESGWAQKITHTGMSSWVTDKRINTDAPGWTKILFILIHIYLYNINYIYYFYLYTYIHIKYYVYD